MNLSVLRALSIALCIVPVASALAATPPKPKPKAKPAVAAQPSLNSRAIALATDSVRSVLKDPSSAQFAAVTVLPGEQSSEKVVCGAVNAKNSFGGYGGQEAFAVTLKQRDDGNLDRVGPPIIGDPDENIVWLHAQNDRAKELEYMAQHSAAGVCKRAIARSENP